MILIYLAVLESGELSRPLTPILLKSTAIHLPFLLRCFYKSMASSWQKVENTPTHDTAPTCIAIVLQKHEGEGSLEHSQIYLQISVSLSLSVALLLCFSPLYHLHLPTCFRIVCSCLSVALSLYLSIYIHIYISFFLSFFLSLFCVCFSFLSVCLAVPPLSLSLSLSLSCVVSLCMNACGNPIRGNPILPIKNSSSWSMADIVAPLSSGVLAEPQLS